MTATGGQRSRAFDLIVIGAGAAGLGAARTARARGATVAVIERARIGGDCTFTGCIPSKCLLEAARRRVPFAEAAAEMRDTIGRVAAREDAIALRHEGIEVITGEAGFRDATTLAVDGRLLRAGSYVIAAGAEPHAASISGLESTPHLTSTTLFELAHAPARLAVIGAGPIGVEMSSAFAGFGSAVTLLESAERVLPAEEPLASAITRRSLVDLGVDVRTGALIRHTEHSTADGGVMIQLGNGDRIDVDRLLVAVGRRPRTDALGLDRAGVKVDGRGWIVVDRRLRTSARRIFAAGDVTGPPHFTHIAYQAGRIAALNALSRTPVWRSPAAGVPHVTFTDPEVARVGVTERDAAAVSATVAFLPMSEVDRALAAGRPEGFVKLIASHRRVLGGLAGGRLVGATIVAPRAGEMLQELALAVRIGLFPAQLATTLHPYPSWSVAVQQAAAQFFGMQDGRTARPASPAAAEREAEGLCR